MRTIQALRIANPEPQCSAHAGMLVCTPIEVRFSESSRKIEHVERLHDGFSMIVKWGIKRDGTHGFNVKAGYPNKGKADTPDNRFALFEGVLAKGKSEALGLDGFIERFSQVFVGPNGDSVLASAGDRNMLYMPSDGKFASAIVAALNELISGGSPPAPHTLH